MSQRPAAGSFHTHVRGPVPPGRTDLRRWLAGSLLLGLVATLLVVTPAAATTTDPLAPADDRTARLVVNGLDAVVGPAVDESVPASEQNVRLPSSFRARLLVQNRTDETLEDLDLVMVVYRRATTRSGLREALDGPGPAAVSGLGRVVLEQAIDPVPPHGIAQVEVDVDAVEAGLLEQDDVAVHPVVIALAQGFQVLDEVRTAAVGVARPIARPLETVVVVPLDGPVPATDDALEAVSGDLLPGGRLDRLLRAVEAAPPTVVTAAPAPHAVEDLGDLVERAVPGATDVLERLRTVSTERVAGVVSTPYALADVPALTSSSSTEDLAAAAIVAGRQRLLGLVGAAPDGAHLLISSQTATSLDLAPADVLLTRWDASAGPDLDAEPEAEIPPGLRRAQSSSGRSLDLLVGDPWVTEQLADADGDHGWAVDAHRVVVESAITFSEAPGREGRAFTVLPPLGWQAPGRLADEVLQRLTAAPWLRPADPVTVAARSSVSAPWTPAESIAADRTALLSSLATLRDRLSGLAAAVVEFEDQPAVVRRGDDLLRAASAWPHRTPQTRAQGILDDLEAGIGEAIGEIIVPDDSVVTLASETGVIPITVRHPEGVPMDVVVEVAAPGGLSFDQGTRRPVRLEQGGTATVSFETRARGRGTFPLGVTVRTPTGDVVLARALVSVRASAVSRPALFAVGGVVLLLLVVGRLRRPSRPRLEVVR